MSDIQLSQLQKNLTQSWKKKTRSKRNDTVSQLSYHTDDVVSDAGATASSLTWANLWKPNEEYKKENKSVIVEEEDEDTVYNEDETFVESEESEFGSE